MAEDDRLRVPIDDPYLHSLGLAVICFARMEWNAVYVAQRIGENGHNRGASPNYLKKSIGLTAGDIAKDLVRYAEGIKDSGLRQQVLAPAQRFKDLVERRNHLLHGKPATSPNGDQRLFHDNVEWTIDGINEASDDFTECSGQLNHLLYHVLV